MDTSVGVDGGSLCWDTGSSDAHQDQEQYLTHHEHQGDALVDLQHLESQGEVVVHLDRRHDDLNNQTDEVSVN
jgi:hypothetical protein